MSPLITFFAKISSLHSLPHLKRASRQNQLLGLFFCRPHSVYVRKIRYAALFPKLGNAYSLMELTIMAISYLEIYRGPPTVSIIFARAIFLVDAFSQVYSMC